MLKTGRGQAVYKFLSTFLAIQYVHSVVIGNNTSIVMHRELASFPDLLNNSLTLDSTSCNRMMMSDGCGLNFLYMKLFLPMCAQGLEDVAKTTWVATGAYEPPEGQQGSVKLTYIRVVTSKHKPHRSAIQKTSK